MAVSLQYVVNATGNMGAMMEKWGLSAEKLDSQLADLSKRVATPEVDLKDAKFALGMTNAAKRLDKLSEMVADPEVTVDGAKAQLEILRITAMLDRLDAKKVTAEVKVKVDRGPLDRLGGLLKSGGGIGGIAGTAGGALAIGAAIGPALVGLSQITSALAAAGAGLVAFGALAAPQFLAVKNVLSQVNLDTAAYERATTKAARSTALKRIQKDWADISPAQRQAAHGVQALQTEFGKLSAKLAPLTFKVFNDVLKVTSDLLPALVPFARAAGNALDGLLKGLDKFTQTTGFKAFLAQLQSLSGPAITALGQGMGKIAIAVGKLILVSAQPNSIKVLSGLLTVLAGTIDVITFVVGRASGKIVEWKNDFGDIGRVVAGVFRSIGGFYARDRALQRAWAHDVAAGFDTVRHAVASFGHDIAGAFDDVRHAFATIGHDIADTFDRIRHFQGQFDAFGKDVRLVRHWITDAFDAIRHGGAIAFDALRHAVATAWDRMWSAVMSALGTARHDIAAAWDAIWHHTTDQAQNGVGNIVDWFKKLPGRVLGALFGLGHQLYAFARSALNDFLSGLKSIAGAVFSWIGHFVANIWDKVKRFFGQSPPHPGSKFYELGRGMMLHLEAGIKAHAHRAADAARAASRSVTSGALGGDALANQALARRIFPWPASQWGPFVSLVMAESGFDRFARNQSSGAYGIAQALPPTKYPFAGQAAGGSHAGAQLSWMFNYIAQRYGTPAGAWAHELSAHWYDQGGWLPPGVSVAVNQTGRSERVLSPGGGGAQTIVLEVRSGASAFDAALAEIIRKYVRVRGGNVQQVLGRT